MRRSPDPQLALGRAIRLRREELELTQQQVADDSGLSPQWLSNLESGQQNPSYGTVGRIARALQLTTGQLAALADTLETQDRRPLDKPLEHDPRAHGAHRSR